jgi:hypothetical protein
MFGNVLQPDDHVFDTFVTVILQHNIFTNTAVFEA